MFIKNDLLALYNQAGKKIGTVDKNTGEISLDAAFKDTIDVQVVFSSNIPVINLKEKTTGKSLFTVTLK